MAYTLGIIGGMGPKASSYFLSRLYGNLQRKTDKDYPDIIMLSISSFADRSNVILNRNQSQLYDMFGKYVDYLNMLNISEIVIPCFTMHAVIRSLKKKPIENLVMLDTFLLDLLKKNKERTLLLCTKGTLSSKLFALQDDGLLIEPDLIDCQNVHEMIYSIKSGGVNRDMLIFIRKLVKKYSVTSVAYGCTELHMLHNLQDININWKIIDPLEEIINLFMNNDLSHFHAGRISIKSLLDQAHTAPI